MLSFLFSRDLLGYNGNSDCALFNCFPGAARKRQATSKNINASSKGQVSFHCKRRCDHLWVSVTVEATQINCTKIGQPFGEKIRAAILLLCRFNLAGRDSLALLAHLVRISTGVLCFQQSELNTFQSNFI